MSAGLPSDAPYASIAAELVADAIALGRLVELCRPESVAVEGVYQLVLDARNGVILFFKVAQSGELALVESIAADPRQPARFGHSVLPVDPQQQWH